MKGDCEDCNKKATVHFTEIVDGQVTELHLCEDCPKLKQAQLDHQFGVEDLLAGLTDFQKDLVNSGKAKLECSNCGLDYEEFKKFGRLGCSQCYGSFRSALGGLLKNIHGSNLHHGKKPLQMDEQVVNDPAVSITDAHTKQIIEKSLTKEEKLSQLKVRMDQAIEAQNFEQAAIIRDQIKEIEEN